MISGTKISQLPVLASLQDTDYFPVIRGATTNRISGLVLNTAALNTVKASFPINYSSNVLTLSSSTILLSGSNTNFKTNVLTVSGTQVIEASSSNAALRVTQTGSGNAIVVEDSINPDATPFVVNQFGQIISGSLSAWHTQAGLNITNKPESNSVLAIRNISNSAASTGLQIHKARGTEGNLQTLSAEDSIGAILFRGYTGDNFSGIPALTDRGFRNVAAINASVDGVPVLSSIPTRLTFNTTLSNATSATERLRITHDGKIGIGTTTPNELLTISGNVSANTVFANLSGNAATTSKWQTPRAITLSGVVVGTTLADGAQDVAIITTLSAGVIVDNNISNNANISDAKLAPITTDRKVSPTAIDYVGSQPGQVLMSTGSATIWQSLSSSEFNILPGTITNAMLGNEIISTNKILDNAVTTTKISADSVTTSKIANNAITSDKILNGAVTLEKTLATAAAIPNSLVSRDLSGNLSAVQVTANLRGNAQTASSWLAPMTLKLAGDIIGETSFNGSQTTTINTTNLSKPGVWALYRADILDNISVPFIQGTANTPSDEILITQPLSSTRLTNDYGSFTQSDLIITVNLSSLANIDNINTDFLAYNLLTSTPLTAIFSNTNNPPLSGEYTITTVTPGTTSLQLTLETTFSQIITSGNISILYNETFFNRPHNFEVGHIINVAFLSSVSLTSTAITAPTSGLYVVTSVPNAVSLTLSSNLTQSASGQATIYRCTVRDNFGIPNVTYIDVGQHILNFEQPFDSPFHYTVTGSGTSPTLSSGPFMSSVENPFSPIQNQLNLEVRTILFNGSLQFFDFNRTSVLCTGTIT